MLNSLRTLTSVSKTPTQYRPLKVMEGDHKLTREYHVYHYTNKTSADSIMKSGELKPGPGNLGVGIYLTRMHPNKGFTPEEIKTAVRNPTIPDTAISDNIRIDTDDLDKKGIDYMVKVNTVFIKIETSLDIKGISEHEETPLPPKS